MKKIGIIVGFVIIFFLVEFFIYNLFGQNFTPNFLFLLVIFFNLYLGIRYSLFIAIVAGLLMDSVHSSNWGIEIFSFVICAYMTIIFKQYLFHMGSRATRLLLVFLVTTFYVVIQGLLRLMNTPIHFTEVFYFVYLPIVISTLIATNLTFRFLRKCVSRLSV